MVKIEKLKKLTPLISFFIFYIIFFLQALRGIGQYWDWSFPYFSEDIGNILLRANGAWTEQYLGKPLGYSTDMPMRIFFSFFDFLKPELLRYLSLVIIFSVGSFAAYKIVRRINGKTASILVSTAVMINPGTVYKLQAGHFNFLVAYSLLIVLILVILNSKKSSIKTVLKQALLIFFIFSQIQLGIFAILIVFVSMATNNKDRKALAYLVTLLVGILAVLSAFWVLPYLVSNSISDASRTAAGVSSFNSASTSLSDILLGRFSNATLIPRLYNGTILLSFSFILGFYLYNLSRRYKRIEWYDLLVIPVILLISGGILNLNVPYLGVFFSVLRETGHFVPVLLLFLLLSTSLAEKRPERERITFLVPVLLILAISIITFQQKGQFLDFENARTAFREFKEFEDNNNIDGNILIYPFFDQYSIATEKQPDETGAPLKNSGHDSYSAFSGNQFIPTVTTSPVLKESLQYDLLTNRNTSVLKDYGVQYVYDMSSIYKTNYYKYIARTEYDEPSIFDSDVNFLSTLSEKNPGKLERVTGNIWRYTPYQGSVLSTELLLSTERVPELENSVETIGRDINKNLNFTTENSTYASRIVDASSASKSDLENFSSTITDLNNGYLAYSYNGVILELYTRPYYLVDNDANYNLVKTLNLDPKQTYYLSNSDDFVKIELGFKDTNLQSKKTISVLEIKNQIFEKGDFSSGLWNERVSDCKNTDNDPDISMKLEESTGNNYLSLRSGRHTACTHRPINFSGDESTSKFLLKINSRSKGSSEYARFSIFGDGIELAGSSFVTKSEWSTFTTLFDKPRTDVELYLYSPESKRGDSITEYDDILIFETETIFETSLKQKYFFGDIRQVSADLFEAENIDLQSIDYSIFNECPNSEATFDDTVVTIRHNQRSCLSLIPESTQSGDYFVELSIKTKKDIEISAYSRNQDFTSGTSINRISKLPDYQKLSIPVRINKDPGTWKIVIEFKSSILNKLNDIVVQDISVIKKANLSHSMYLLKDIPLGLVRGENTYSDTHKKSYKLNLTESGYFLLPFRYHDKWTADKISDENHFELNGWQNGWFVDVEDLCVQRQLCTQNEDGSWNIELTIEFTPQKWFYVGSIISGTTFVAIIGYLIYDWRKGRGMQYAISSKQPKTKLKKRNKKK